MSDSFIRIESIRTDSDIPPTGLEHAGVAGDEYGDYSGNMGGSTVRRGGPLMCYNAANHWDLGWFSNARRDLGSAGPSTPITITLTAFTSYPSGSTVLVKVGNIYLQYNQAAAHNIDTDGPTANQLVVIEKHSNILTSRLADLDQGDEYRAVSFVVRVCSKLSTSMDISIGRSSTNCGVAVSSSPPPPAPVPRPPQAMPPSRGNNWAPVEAPTVVNIGWNSGPAPSPQFPRPTPSFPAPSAIARPTSTYFRPTITSIFSPTPPATNWFQAPPSRQPGWSWVVSSPVSKPWTTCLFGC
jgi:Gametolysin peptidase M11